ncbi:MAG: quinoprotein dehydrogenase-associated SoxYZ-like carrier [Burkholderiales bacterium]|nr:quinoprotein dehydrogenase-associated SoxYZ-like carrier [Burkholderiales bacterium]
MQRRRLIAAASLLATGLPPGCALADEFEGDPYRSHLWPALRAETIGAKARWRFDDRVEVQGPAFAEDPMNVPVTVRARLDGVQRIVVVVDRNPIKKVLELQPVAALPVVSFRFKLEQASPVRALVQTQDGQWHVGGTWVDSAGGGCTVSGATRADGSWSKTLGEVSGRSFSSPPGNEGGSRLRLRIMHPMDTGLVSGIPAFYLSRLSLRDARQRELLRLQTFEPLSENPVLSFDFRPAPPGPLRVVGTDNNGNRIDTVLP